MMKKVLVLLLLVFALVSCNKDVNENTSFIGRWELNQVSGGLHGNGYISHFKYLYFIDDTNCKWTDKDDVFIVDGTYDLSENDGKDFIEFSAHNDSLIYNFYSFKLEYKFISSDSLYMDQGCCDLYDFTFIKAK